MSDNSHISAFDFVVLQKAYRQIAAKQHLSDVQGRALASKLIFELTGQEPEDDEWARRIMAPAGRPTDLGR